MATHKNAANAIYYTLCPWSGSNSGVNSQYTLIAEGAGLTETWGNAFVLGSMGFQSALLNKLEANQYSATFTPPSSWGSPLSDGPHSGALPGGSYIRTQSSNDWKLVVNSDCTWTLSFTLLTVYLNYGSGETTMGTYGPVSMSGSNYDERLNITLPDAYGTLTNPLPPNLICLPLGTGTGSWPANSLFGPGGYEYSYDGGVTKIQDPIILDTSSTPGSCSCLANLPSLVGTNSYNVQVEWTIAASIVQGPTTTVPCPPAVINYTWWNLYSYWKTTQTSISIKDDTPSIGSQLFQNNWECYPTPGSPVSGSSSVTTTPSLSSCQSSRSVVVNNQEQAGCYTPHTVPIGWVPCWTTGYTACQWIAGASITWPILPCCTTCTVSALDYDVSTSLRHGRAFISSSTNTLFTGYAANGNPYLWNDLNSGIACSGASIRWQDSGNRPLGILYNPSSSASILYWVHSPDEGNTFSSPMTITSSLATGGFYDFDEIGNFNRYFIWEQGSSAPYTLYYKILDRNLNVITGPTATNVTNADKSPIRIKWSPVAGGGVRYGLEYTVSGVLTFLTSRDGTNFS